MSTLSAIKDAAMEIRDFIRREMTPEFIANVKSTIKSISETINDPNVQDDIKESLRQLRKLLESANDSKIFEKISNVLVDVDKILKSIDPDSIKNIISAINNMLSGQRALKEVYEKLSSVHCLRDLKEVGDMLLHPTAALALGVYAPVIGFIITGAAKYTLNKISDPIDAEVQKKLLETAKMQLLDSINQSRLMAFGLLRKAKKDELKPGFVATPLHIQLKTESQNTLNATLPLSKDSQLLMQKMQLDCEKVLKALYQPKLDNESMTDYLSSVESDMSSWDKILEYVIYSPQLIGGKKEKPKLPLDTINYAQIQRLYSSNAVDNIMNELAKNFAAKGGNDLYSTIANSFKNSPQQFLEYSISISTNETQCRFPGSENSVPAEKLSTYYLRAGENVKRLWGDTDWKQHGSSEKPELTTRVSKIIIARAYLQFVHHISPHLYFPKNLPREIVNAALDVPKGLVQTVIHPINTLKGLGSLFTVSGWKNIGSSAVNHPVRFFGSTALGAATGFGASKLITGVPHPVNPLHLSGGLHNTHSTISSQLSLLPTTSSSSLLSFNSSSNEGGRNNSRTSIGNAADLNYPPNITDKMFNQLLKQLAKSINPKITYSIWYEKQVLGKKVPDLSEAYKKNLRLIESSGTKEGRSASSTMAKGHTIGLFSAPDINSPFAQMRSGFENK